MKELSKLNQHYADIAASIQKVTEEMLLTMAKHLRQTTGMTRLCMAGGVALNSVANTRILREIPIEELYIQPAAGMAAELWERRCGRTTPLLGSPANFTMDHASWGRELSRDAEITTSLATNNVPHPRQNEDEAAGLAWSTVWPREGGGWSQARFEWGPRALGIAASWPIRVIPNEGHREHEDQIPRAVPSVCAVGAGGVGGDLLRTAERNPSLSGALHAVVVPVREEEQATLPAITHVDGTGRLQHCIQGAEPALLRPDRAFCGRRRGCR